MLPSKATSIAESLLEAPRGARGFDVLCSQLQLLCRFRNFIAFRFERGRQPVLVYTNLDMSRVQEQMANYIRGLHLLDPFCRVDAEGGTGLFRLGTIAPEEFTASEFYRRHYRFTDVIDELRYIVPLDEGVSVHLFIEREAPSESFGAADIAALQAIAPLVRAFTRGLLRHDARQSGAGVVPTSFNLAEKVRAISDKLTDREGEIIEMMLKGHSAKSVARLLGIEAGTVANHKRNIYAKLEIHSQAQLFDLFLRTL